MMGNFPGIMMVTDMARVRSFSQLASLDTITHISLLCFYKLLDQTTSLPQLAPFGATILVL